MRGKPGICQIVASAMRNIPAYAGKTAHPLDAARLIAEHPRVCGENTTGIVLWYA